MVLRTLAAWVAFVVALGALAACASDDDVTTAGGRLRVVAAFYPLAEAARQVGGRRVEVVDLTPAGAEPHDLEVTPKQVDEVASAGVVLVMGHGFQPSVEDAARNTDATTVVLDHLPVDASGRDVARGLDPHVWLDPVLMRRIVTVTMDALARAEPAARATFERDARAYDARLAALDREYAAGLADCDRRTIFTTHAAFGWLALRYDLDQQSLTGVSPDAEPTPDRIAELADRARDDGATTIFTEPLVPEGIAKTLAREAGGLRTATLDPLEALSRDAQAHGDDYVSVMRDNLATLRSALGCR
jgi:zinc transport system substrate-binding protein